MNHSEVVVCLKVAFELEFDEHDGLRKCRRPEMRSGFDLKLSICFEVVRVLVESFVFRVIFPVPAPVSVGLKL